MSVNASEVGRMKVKYSAEDLINIDGSADGTSGLGSFQVRGQTAAKTLNLQKNDASATKVMS